jgi:hypothetical protein
MTHPAQGQTFAFPVVNFVDISLIPGPSAGEGENKVQTAEGGTIRSFWLCPSHDFHSSGKFK